MVFKDESAIKRLGELTKDPISLEIVVLEGRRFRLETKKFSEVHEIDSITVYRDGLEIEHPPRKEGQYGQLYIKPLSLVVSYFLPSEAK